MAEKGAKVRDYVILRLVDPNEQLIGEQQLWEVVRVESAASKDAASRQASQHVTDGDSEYAEGTFKAVAAAAWRGALTVDNEVKTVPRFRQATGLREEAETEEGEQPELTEDVGEGETET